MQDFNLCKAPLCKGAKPKLTLTLRIMKLTAILLLTACLQVSAKGYSQRVTLSVKDAPLEKVFASIERQTDYNFMYNHELLKTGRPVSIQLKDATLEEILLACFKEQPFTYAIVNKLIVIKGKNGTIVSSSAEWIRMNTPPSTVDIRGRVINKEGEPLASATVVLKRTGRGTQTDANGNFSLKDVNPNDILEISYTGYNTQSLKIGDRTTFTFILDFANNELDQLIVQAYGQTTRRLATGNIAKVTSEEIAKQPVINPLQALQGRVPGLVVTQTSGFASAPFKVELRGRNNINDRITSDPLYIIDGVPLTISEIAGSSSYINGPSGFSQNGISTPAGGQSPFFSINPEDIESIEVLKDADATAIYGSRAANGVILITTKKGKSGKANFNININQGVSQVTRYWDMLNTQQYIEMRKEAFNNDNITMTQSNAYDILTWDTTRYTDWQKYTWGRTGKTTDVQMGLSGGNNQTTFRISTGYNHRGAITSVSGSDQRASASFNLAFRGYNNRFNLSFSNSYSFSQSDMVHMPGTNVVRLAPNTPDVIDSIGKLNYSGWKPANYPVANLFQPYTAKTNFLNSNLTISYQLLNGLSFRSSFGYNSSNVKQTKFTPISSLDPNTSPTGIAIFGSSDISNWIIEPQIEYNNLISKGKFSILIGSTIQSNSTEGQSVTGSGYTSDLLLKTISNAPSKNANEFLGQYRYAAIFGRITYNWANKYILNLSARRDGSSRFGEGKQFGNFGAFGVAWIFSQESLFKKHLQFLSFGKIRGSYGTTGSDAIGDYQYLTRWSSSGTFPYSGSPSLLPLQHANDQYHWPTNRKLEAAIDLGVLKDRISLSIAWYRNRCNDQLISFPLALYTGFNTVTANSPAFVQNTGWEFNITGKIIATKNFNWSLNFNTGINRNKLLSYPNIEQSPYANLYMVGKSLNIVKKLHYTGVDPQTGLYTFEDLNKDGNISRTNGTADDRIIFDVNPKFTGGLGTNLSYKGIELSSFFYVVKQIGINALYSFGANPGTRNNTSTYMFNNRWQNPGDIAKIAKFTTGSGGPSYSNFYDSDGAYTDASFIRLSNLSLSYSLPETFIRKAGIQAIRLRVSAQNLFTITNYKGIDPETQNFGGMPPAKVITGGLNFNF